MGLERSVEKWRWKKGVDDGDDGGGEASEPDRGSQVWEEGGGMGVEVRAMRRETKGGRSFGRQGAVATEREGRFAPFPPREFLGGSAVPCRQLRGDRA